MRRGLVRLNITMADFHWRGSVQGILFKGKMLGNEESLSDAGVADGDNLLIVPKAGFSRPRPAAAGGVSFCSWINRPEGPCWG